MLDFGTNRKYKPDYKAEQNLAFVATEEDAIKILKYLSYQRGENTPFLKGATNGIEDGLQEKLEEKAQKLQQEQEMKKLEDVFCHLVLNSLFMPD